MYLCLKTLAADSMRPNKLRRHLETLHPSHDNNCFVKAVSVIKKALIASYKVTYRIFQCKKPHRIAEELILPAALDVVSTMLDETSAAKLKAVPLSKDTAARLACDISYHTKFIFIQYLAAFVDEISF